MTRTILAALALVLTIPLAACGPAAPPASAGTDAPAPEPTLAADQNSGFATKLAKLERRYDDAKAFVNLVVAFAAPERVAQLHAIEARIDQTFVLARSAATVADQASTMRRIEAAIVELLR